MGNVKKQEEVYEVNGTEEVELTTEEQAANILDALLSSDIVVTDKFYIARLGTFTVRGIGGEEYQALQTRATVFRGTGKNRTKELDVAKLQLLLIQKGTVSPNWGDPKLLAKYNTHDPLDVINRALLAGEQDHFANKITSLSGYVDETEYIEQTKN